MGNCAASRLSFLSGHMQGLIDIAGNVVLGQAVGKVSPGMTSPALIFLSSYIATCFLHCFVGGVCTLWGLRSYTFQHQVVRKTHGEMENMVTDEELKNVGGWWTSCGAEGPGGNVSEHIVQRGQGSDEISCIVGAKGRMVMEDILVINKYELIGNCSCIWIKNSLKQTTEQHQK